MTAAPPSEAFETLLTYVKRNRGFDAERTHRELETAHEELQATIEELETTNEELQSTNEELETTNEELQSTNEELETMNEELQSTDEEMDAINDEFRMRTEEVAQVNSFLEAMLGGLQAAVIAVGRDLRIHAWNRAAVDLWGLRRDEVEGAHLLNLDTGFPVHELRRPIRTCLEAGEPQELVADATNRRGRPVECRVTCTPLRGPLGDIQGAIVLMEATERQ